MKDIQWSYSSLKDFIGCPKRYQEVKVLKNYEFQPTAATTYGNKVHAALENYVKSGIEIPANYQRFKVYADALLELPGEKFTEHHMALTLDRQPCGFYDKNRWVRGIADLLIINGEDAAVIDYKTGSEKYPDPDQLKLMAILTFAHFPEVMSVNAGLFFIAKDVVIDEQYKREDIDTLWTHFTPHLERLSYSYENDDWPTNPTALCRFCPVVTCNFNKA